jgi:hypothetical protein
VAQRLLTVLVLGYQRSLAKRNRGVPHLLWCAIVCRLIYQISRLPHQVFHAVERLIERLGDRII